MRGRGGCGVDQPHRADPCRGLEDGDSFVLMAVPPVPGTEPGTHSGYSLHIY